MKKILWCLAVILPLWATAQRMQPYRKPLPDISGEGVIRQPNGPTIELKGYKDASKKVFFLMRHAEKDTLGGSNADLNDEGRLRARALAFMFTNVAFEAIYTTRVPRVISTVKPTAQSQKLAIGFYDAKKQTEWAATLFNQPQRILMIGGHSNTIPGLVNVLTGQTTEKNLPDDNYNTLFIVVAEKFGKGELYKITY